MLRTGVFIVKWVLSRVSHVLVFATSWTVADQAPLFTGFSTQDYWSRLPCTSPGIFPSREWNWHLLCLLHWQAGSLPPAPPQKTLNVKYRVLKSVH